MVAINSRGLHARFTRCSVRQGTELLFSCRQTLQRICARSSHVVPGSWKGSSGKVAFGVPKLSANCTENERPTYIRVSAIASELFPSWARLNFFVIQGVNTKCATSLADLLRPSAISRVRAGVCAGRLSASRATGAGPQAHLNAADVGPFTRRSC